MQVIKYVTEEEKQKIVSEKTSQGYVLVEVQNITEGNFLGFASEADLQVVPNPEPSEFLESLQSQQAQIDQLTIMLGDALLGGM